MNLLQRCIFNEFVTMIVFHTNNTISKKRAYWSKRETHIRQIKKIVESKKKSLINQEKRIHAKNIDYFVIIIDLILRQNLIEIEKFEFALFASMYVRHLQSQSFFVYFIQLTHFLNLLRSNCMSEKSIKSTYWMKHLRYSRKVNNDSTQQELIFSKRKFIIISFIIVTRIVCATLDVCSKTIYFSFENQRVLNLVVLKNIFEDEKSNYWRRNCLKRHSNCNNIFYRYDQIVNELLRITNTQISKRLLKTHAKFDSLYFKSTNEKTIEIWTYISINKQSICSMTLSKQMRLKTM